MTLQLSEFTQVMEIDPETHLLYNSLFLKPIRVIGSDFSMEKLEHLPKDASEILEKHHILVNPGDDERVLQKILSLRKKPAINTCVLLLTERCNLRCRYCFIEKNLACKSKQSTMSRETAIKALHYFARINKGETPSLVLYGGEPLLNKPVISSILEELDEMVKYGEIPPTRVSINTNGTLIDDETAALFKKHGVTVSISLDGTRQQNADRIQADGSESYDAVLKGISICRNHGVKYGISVTATPKLLSDYREGIEQIGSLCPSKVGINPLLAAGPLYPEYGKDLCDMMIESKSILNGMGVEEDRLTDRLGYLENRRFKYHDCSAAKGEQIGIVPDGSIGICHEFIGTRDFFIGHIDSEEDIYQNGYLTYWVNRTPFNMEQCRKCPAIAICGGGCPANAFQNESDLYGLDVTCCGTSKRLLEWYFENNPTNTELRL